DALVIDAKTQRWTAIVCLMPSALLRREVATGAWIAWAFRPVGCAGDAGNLRARAVTRIHEVSIDEVLQVEGIDFLPLALHIGCVTPTNIRSLVPIQTKPAQVSEHVLCCCRSHTGPVQVLNTHHELTTSAASEKPGQQGSTQVAEVQITCWTGCISTAYLFGQGLVLFHK